MDSLTKNSPPQTNTRKCAKGHKHGFTLPELMIAMVIFSFAIGGVYSVFFSFSRSTKVMLEHTEDSYQSQYAFESIHKALRAISDIHYTYKQAFEFTTTNLDGSTERVRIYYHPQMEQLIRKSITNNTERTLLYDVKDVDIEYYDRKGIETNSDDNTNAAKIKVDTLRKNIGNEQIIETETAVITFRNRTL